MVELLPYAKHVPAADYICADCGYVLTLEKTRILPFCPERRLHPHSMNGWRPLYGLVSSAGSGPRRDRV